MTNSEFILAQQRVAARRMTQEALHHSSSSQRASHPTNRAAPLLQIRNIIHSTWAHIRGREGTRPSFRVGQVDAELLDEELLGILKTQVSDGLKYYGSHLQDDWAAEITLGLRAVLFKLTVWDHGATYGAALQNLRYSDARHRGEDLISPSSWQKFLYGLLTTGGPYAWTRWSEWLMKRNRGYNTPSELVKKLYKLHDAMETFHSIAAFANFLAFLVNGRYRTLLDRLLKLRLAPPTNQVGRQVSFEYLNRQLVWHAFTEFLLFFLPLVGVSKWRKWFTRFWRKTKSRMMKGIEDIDSAKTGQLAFLPESICAICYLDQNPGLTSETEAMASLGSTGVINSAQTGITNPYENTSCGCIYCFVCIASQLEAEDGDAWICLRCGEEVRECKPWHGDVIEEKPRPIVSSKTVVFSEPDLKMKVIESYSEVKDHSEPENEPDSFPYFVAL
ncbi:Peroxisomal biogenesis factor 2 [Podosphaera aphanis]|nr:Peroxisomal biogenesis factor 2 [Podosphaera aphanis]